MKFTILIVGERHELTSWLPGIERPQHAGVYQRHFPAGPYSCWDGRQWRADSATPDAAALVAGSSRHQQASWRGLAAPSTQPCLTCRGHGAIDEGDDPDSGEPRIEPCPDC